MTFDYTPASFGSQQTAARVRDVIRRLSTNQITAQVPRPLVGRVISVDLPRLRGTVWFPGDDQPIEVSIFANAVPAQWESSASFVGVSGDSISGAGSIVVCERLNGILYIVHVLSGGQSALDFKSLNFSLLLQEGADTVAGGPSANAAVDIAGKPHETYFNCHVSNDDVLIGEAIEFGPFTTFDPGTPGPGFIEMSITVEGCIKYYRFVSNPLFEYDNTFFTAARPSAWFTIMPSQSAAYHETSAPYTETTDFQLDITFRRTSYGNTDAFATFKEMWFRITKRKSISSSPGLDAKITIRATNVQKGRSLGGRELFMQERAIAPEIPMGRVGFDNSSHFLGQFSQQYIKDTFGRVTAVGGWGKFDWTGIGTTWQINTGTTTDFLTDGQYGIININANNTYYEIGSSATGVASIDDIISFVVPAVTTGAQIQVGTYIAVNPVASGDRYLLCLDFKTGGTIEMTFRKKVSGTVSVIGSATATGLSYTTGTKVHARFNMELGTGVATKYLRAKVWLDGTDEPEAWTKDITDATVTISSGTWAWFVLAETGNTNTKPYVVKFDKLDGVRGRYSTSTDHPETWHNGPWRSAPLRIAQDLQKTWTCDGVITWDGTNSKLKWTGNIYLSGVGRNIDGLRYGKAWIAPRIEDTGALLGRLPTDPGGSDPNQGLIVVNTPANGIPLAANQSLWVAVPPGTGWDNLYPCLFIVDGNVARDYELPEWAVLIAMRGPSGVSPEIRLGNGTFLDSWKNLSFNTNWSNFGSSYSTGQYKKETQNIVRLKGLIKHTTTNATGVIATLPTGFRPSEIRFNLSGSSAGPTLSASQVDIKTNGDIQVMAHGTAGGTAFISLEGLTFPIE